MPEVRNAANNRGTRAAADCQARYGAMRKATDRPTFDDYPLADVKMRVNLIMKAFDNEIGGHQHRVFCITEEPFFADHVGASGGQVRRAWIAIGPPV
jgi:hypothetical protein